MQLTEDILFYAFRYALGRKTYAVSDVVGALTSNWNEISRNTKEIIIKEILNASSKEGLGMDCDKQQWLSILQLNKEQKS